MTGVEVTGFERGSDDRRRRRDERGRIEVGETVVLAPGPWAKEVWAMLGLPDRIDVHTPSGEVVRDRPMWTYWNLQEGEIEVDPLSSTRPTAARRPSSTSTPTRRSMPTTAL